MMRADSCGRAAAQVRSAIDGDLPAPSFSCACLSVPLTVHDPIEGAVAGDHQRRRQDACAVAFNVERAQRSWPRCARRLTEMGSGRQLRRLADAERRAVAQRAARRLFIFRLRRSGVSARNSGMKIQGHRR